RRVAVDDAGAVGLGGRVLGAVVVAERVTAERVLVERAAVVGAEAAGDDAPLVVAPVAVVGGQLAARAGVHHVAEVRALLGRVVGVIAPADLRRRPDHPQRHVHAGGVDGG